METSETTAKLQEALAKAQAEISGASKDGKGNYGAYTTLASAWDAWHEVGPKHGLSVTQSVGRDETGLILTTRLGHSSGEWMQDSMPLLLGKNDMQGLGSAITYGRRYSLMAMVGLAPEDDDGEAAVATGPAKPVQGKPAPKKAAPAQTEEPPHVKDAKDIIAKAEKITDADEYAAFFDGCGPRFAAIKDASENTHAYLMKKLGEVEASLRIAA